MTEFLTWTAYGPLAAWGNIAVGERRTTDAQASKSAMVGWLSGALGLRRTEMDAIEAIACGYRFASLLEHTGTLLSDYHTVQRPAASAYRRRQVPTTRRDALGRPVNTSLTRREYAQDSLSHMAISAVDSAPYPLSRLRAALAEPVFEPYLGRKSCPLGWPPNPRIREAKHPLAALEDQARDPLLDEWVREPARRARAWGSQESRLFWEGEWDGLVPSETSRRRDVPIDRVGWYFREREEHSRPLADPEAAP